MSTEINGWLFLRLIRDVHTKNTRYMCFIEYIVILNNDIFTKEVALVKGTNV